MKHDFPIAFTLIISALLVIGCSTPPVNEAPASLPEPTHTQSIEPAKEAPTNIPTIAPTPTLESTATPDGLIFRDDFTGAFRPEWKLQNENPGLWQVTGDGWLQIVAEDDSLLINDTQTNTFLVDLPEGDFEISAHLQAQPFENFHQAAIFLYEDAQNYVAINRGYCEPCGGTGIYMDYKIGGTWGSYKQMLAETDIYLKLLSQDKIISGFYATSPGNWVRLGRFGDYFAFRKAGLGVTNSDSAGENGDLVGLYDYFEIRRP